MESRQDPILDRLLESGRNTHGRVLFRDAAVLTMDEELGSFPRGDVLIEGSSIVQVASHIDAGDGDTLVIDLSGRVLIPGFVDTHRHCWQNQLRRLIPDCDHNGAYLAVMNDWLGTLYKPHDVYVGNLISSLGCLDAGITTVLDFSHNPRTPEHSDSAIQALVDTGIRAVHTTCGVMGGEFGTTWPADAERLRDTYFTDPEGLLTLRMGAIAGAFARPEIALGAQGVEFARRLGLGFASDGVLGPAASDRVEELGRAGLLGPDILLIHCLDLSDTAWRMIADNGVGVSIPTTSDATIGIAEAVPSIQRALDHGIRPGLSVDVEVSLSSDMFTQMRTLMNIQRMMAFEQRYRGGGDYPAPLTTKDTLELATYRGAASIGLERRTGSITPGKQADLVIIDATDWNTMPLNNAYGSVVTAADTRNVEAVFVAGRVKKWEHQLVGWERSRVQQIVERSRDDILDRAGMDLDILEQKVGLMSHYPDRF